MPKPFSWVAGNRLSHYQHMFYDASSHMAEWATSANLNVYAVKMIARANQSDSTKKPEAKSLRSDAVRRVENRGD
jgi:hypothetical protein